MKKIAFLCLLLLSGAAVLFAADITVRWAYWGGESRVKICQQAIDIFQAANPGIKINPEVSGGTGDHFIKVDTQLAGGAGPDTIQMGGNIADYVKKGALLPLEMYAGGELTTRTIDAGAIASTSLNGHLYGISTGVNMPALVYNKSMLDRAGVALPKVSMGYAEFRAFLATLKSKLPAGVFPMQDIGALPTNSTPVTAADAQKYLDLFKDYRDNGLVPPPDIAAGFAENNADTSAIVAGKVTIGFLWPNQLKGYQLTMKDEINFMELPGAAEKESLWQQPSQFHTVNKDSKVISAAIKFINFLVNSPGAAKVLGNDRGASASSSARAAELTDVNDQKVLKYMTVAGPHSSPETPHLPNDTELNSTLYLIYQQVAFGRLSTIDGGKQIVDMFNRLIKK